MHICYPWPMATDEVDPVIVIKLIPVTDEIDPVIM